MGLIFKVSVTLLPPPAIMGHGPVALGVPTAVSVWFTNVAVLLKHVPVATGVGAPFKNHCQVKPCALLTHIFWLLPKACVKVPLLVTKVQIGRAHV